MPLFLYVRHTALFFIATLMIGPAVRGAGLDSTASDLSAIRAHWEAWETAHPAADLTGKAMSLAAQQQRDGCWTNIDYGAQQVADWRAQSHLDNLSVLATASYVLRHAGTPNLGIDNAALKALRCWLRKDPTNPNWWWNEIGAPKAVGRAALLLEPMLTAEDRANINAVLLRSNWSTWTGQNLVWGADIQLVRGLLGSDATLVRDALDRLYAEVRIAPLHEPNGKPGEGIEADGSFHQHGAQLYSGGYGYSFASDVGRDIVLSWGTAFQAPPETLQIYSHFMLDGEQWMMHAGVFDFIARGREVTRSGETGSAHSSAAFTRVVQALATLPIPRQKEFGRFAVSLQPDGENSQITGNRAFWNSDLIEQKRAGYSTSVRMLSSRTKNEESLNGEGLRSVHLADGVNLLYKSSQEYSGIFPVWDWNLIPGATALQWHDKNGVPVTGEAQSIGQMGRSDFAGEVCDGHYGAAAMVLDRGPLSAKKAWFFFDRLYVALGASIRVSDTAGVPAVSVMTTVEQSRLEGSVAQQRMPDGAHLIAHHGVGYIIAPHMKVDVSSATQSGRWSDIGTGPRTPISLPVFRVTLDHGVRPQDSSYRYVVLPEGGMEAAVREARSPTVRVLANRGDTQAVASADGNLVMAAFYQLGSLETPMGALRVSAPAMVLLRRQGPEVKATVSNPRGTALDLTVTLNGVVTNFQLPGGTDGGRSETQTLTR